MNLPLFLNAINFDVRYLLLLLALLLSRFMNPMMLSVSLASITGIVVCSAMIIDASDRSSPISALAIFCWAATHSSICRFSLSAMRVDK